MLKSVVLGVALSSFAYFSAANAAIVTVSYSGVINEGTDASNYFGVSSSTSATNVDLGNLPALVTYIFDTSAGTFTGDAGSQIVQGGTLYPAGSPALSATVTINNKSFKFVGDDYGSIAASDNLGNGSHLGQSALSTGNDSAYSTVDAALGTFANSITAPLALNSQSTSFTALTFFNLSNGASGDFYAQSFSVSAIPLPSSLPLFAVGLIGLGAAAAFRKRDRLTATR